MTSYNYPKYILQTPKLKYAQEVRCILFKEEKIGSVGI